MPAISKKVEKDAEKAAEEWKFSSKEEFIEEAVEERILRLKEHEFKERTDKIKEKLREKGITEEQILNDFEEKR